MNRQRKSSNLTRKRWTYTSTAALSLLADPTMKGLSCSAFVPTTSQRLRRLSSSSIVCGSTASPPGNSDGSLDETSRVLRRRPMHMPQAPQGQRRVILPRSHQARPAASTAVASNMDPSSSRQNSSIVLSAIQSTANWASFLCILDCTLLPLLSLALPLFEWLHIGTATWQHTLCVWSHGLALYFVLPVGCTTVSLNFVRGHGNWRVAGVGYIGLLLVGLANLDFVPFLSHGALHRVTNLLGCGLLLTSNYLSQQLGCECGIPFCRPGSRASASTATNPLLLGVAKQSSRPTSAVKTSTSSAMSMQTRMVQFKFSSSSSSLLQVNNDTVNATLGANDSGSDDGTL